MEATPLEQRLRALFLEELQDGLQALSAGRASLDDRAADHDEVLREVFRLAHSLKGAAHSANVPAAVTLCHQLEDSFARAQAGEVPLDSGFLEEVRTRLDGLARVERQLRGHAAEPSPTVSAASAASPVLTAAPEARMRVAVGVADELVSEVTNLMDALSRLAVTDRSIHQAVSRLATTVQGLRLQPFTDACVGLAETASDVAAAGGKQVTFVIEGGDTQFDRTVGSALREPLLHLVRNAVDHGIEMPAVRREVGKAPAGKVIVSASLADGTLQVTVADDGAGVDLETLRRAAERVGVAQSHDDVLELAFVPGVSTAPEVTTVSGRGVGLDAVRQRVERIGGSLRIRTEAGRGTSVAFAVPATLATLQVLLVDAGGQLVALPLAAVDRVQQVDRSSMRRLGAHNVLLGDHEPVPVAWLGAALDVKEPPTHTMALLVRLSAAAGGGALEVSGVHEDLEAVLRPLPARVSGVQGGLGVVGLPGGRGLALVVNPATCLRWGLARGSDAGAVEPAPASRRVLLAEDTLTTRALERSILEAAGYAVVTAVDGVQAWQLLQSEAVDIVVTDVDMPGMSGVELCRAIRDSGRFPNLPVVLVTSLGSVEDRRKGVEAGADAYLVKSAFDREALLETVERLL